MKIKNFILIYSALVLLLITNSLASHDEDLAYVVHQPTLGPVLGLPAENTVRIWWRGPKLDKLPVDPEFLLSTKVFGVLSLKIQDEKDWYSTRYIPMETYFDGDGSKPFKDIIAYRDLALKPGRYEYRCGFLTTTEDFPSGKTLYWKNEETYQFSLAGHDSYNPTLVFGSCRYFAKLWCMTPWLDASDQIFGPLLKQHKEVQPVDAIAFIGDYIYADNLSFFNYAESYSDYVELYELAMSTPNFKKLLASMPSFNIWDDHEVYNNYDEQFKIDYPAQFNAASQAYGTYQRMMNPGFIKEMQDPCGGFELSFRGIPGFMLDTRSQRTANPPRIITDEAMFSLKQWLTHYKNHPYKIVFSSVPMFPGYATDFDENNDKWLGYLHQTDDFLSHIDQNSISGVIICSGDIHKCLYAQVRTPANDIIITNITASPYYWPFGHDSGHTQQMQTQVGKTEFILGYNFVKSSEVYPTNAYARLEFLGKGLIDVKLIGTEGEWLNENDPAGHQLDLS